MDRRQHTLCKLHMLKAVQVGSCITCNSSSTVCETKGCVKHHAQSQKMHTIYTLPQIQKITQEYHSSNEHKRSILKKLVNEYFALLKVEIQTLYHEVEQSLKKLRFQNYLMNNRERELSEMLVEKRYSDLTCSDIAMIIPKMLKCSSYEEKQFNHFRDFLHSQKQNLPKTVKSMVLNLPYFRLDQAVVAVQKFTEISHELLSQVNKKLRQLSFRPRKLRIKYSDDQVASRLFRISKSKVRFLLCRGKKLVTQQKFIKLLENSPYLKEVEALELYCVWNVRDEDFQIDFMDAIFSFPYLSAFTLYTAYRVTSTAYIEEMVENKNIELKIYRKQWGF